ncbi:caspase family protein [Nocardia gipuzkoensis]|uniref:caspase family protein n=1 Tax=Nocardia gipuzkoensis TaxID=2749991 RepID=UPI003EE255B6
MTDLDVGGPRRFLIAVAVAEHKYEPGWDRPGLARARDEVIALFTGRFGYELVTVLGMNPTADDLHRRLRAFSMSADRRPDDLVAVYFTGHGARLPSTSEYVLLAADTRPDDIDDAVPARDIGRWMLQGSPLRRLLLMLDTCYAGAGGAALAAEALTDFTRHWRDETGTGVVVVSSAQPRQEAQATAFPRLLKAAVDNLATAGYGPEILAVGAVVTAMNSDPTRPHQQTVGWTVAPLVTGDPPPFLPNPRRDPRLYEVDLAIQQASEWEAHADRRDIEFRTRLLVRAMGNRDNKGWWFCGRHTALTDITTWLTDPHPDRPLLAVTGDPGSGKTAVLGLIATLTHLEYHRTVPLHTLGLPDPAIPPVGAVDVAIYAQNLTLDQVRDGIAAAAHLSAATVGELLDGLHQRTPALTVLIDGLDEAANPNELIRKLLRPLTDHAGGRVRLLAGTRPYLLPALGIDRRRSIDLDAARYADRAALTTYAVRGLLEADPDTIYRGQPPETIRAVATAVAEQADPSFLVARIVAATLSADPHLPDPDDRAWRRSLPALPGAAMRQDLRSRLGSDADRARDLLRPLAFAQGQGLPWEDLWAPLASRLADTSYTDEDLMWLRRTAGSYVVEATETGRSAYRLYHQALAEHLIDGLDPAPIHAMFVEVLRQRVPVTADGDRDWSRAHPYTLVHLATHAAHAGMVDDLVTDTGYLAHANPAALLAALHTVTTDTGHRARAVYRCSAAYHRHLPPPRRRQILAIDAARFHATALQAQFNRGLTWPCRWATGTQTHPAHRATLTGHTSGVRAVACTSINGRPVAVTGSDNGTVRVWDLDTGGEHAVLTGHTNIVYTVACTSIDGGAVAVTGGYDGTVRVWDLDTGGEHVVLTGHTNTVAAVACTRIEGRPVAVTGSNDKTVRVWNLDTGHEHAVLTGHTSGVHAVACTSIDGRTVAVTGSLDTTVRVWDLTTGREHAVLTGHTNTVIAVACTRIDGRTVAVTSGYDATVRVWDLGTGSERAVLTGHIGAVHTVACTSIDGRPVAVTGSEDDTVRVWDLDTGHERAVLTGHTRWVAAVACTSIDGRPVAVTGSNDETVRVWDLDTAQGHADPTGRVDAVATTSIDGRPVAVIGNGDKTVRVWDLDTGRERAVLTIPTNWVTAMACTSIDGRPVALTGSDDATVRVWDLDTGRERAALTGHIGTVHTVACTSIRGQPVALTGSQDEALRVWDLDTGGERAVLTGHIGEVYAVACTNINGRPVAVTGGGDNTVRVWNLDTGRERAALTGHTNTVIAVACTSIDGRPVAVTGSLDETVRVWDLTTGREQAVLTSPVAAVVCTTLDGRPVVITAGNDQTTRIWDLTTMTLTAVIDYPAPEPVVAVSPGADIILGLGNDIAVLTRQPPAQTPGTQPTASAANPFPPAGHSQ